MNTRTGKSGGGATAAAADAGHVAPSSEVEAMRVGNGAGGAERACAELPEGMREFGRSLLDGAQAVADEAARQARLRPLATLGVAVLAGVVIARALRR